MAPPPDDFSNPNEPGPPAADPTPPVGTDEPPGGEGGEEPPPVEAPRMLSAAMFGRADLSQPLTISRAGGTDAEFADFFEKAARQLRGL